MDTPSPRLAVPAFWAVLLLCLTPWASPPLALAAGLLLAATLGHPYAAGNSRVTRILLQASVVGLGFGMPLGSVIAAGRQGMVFALATIAGTLTAGHLLGHWLGVSRRTAHLVASGTAICGGSAIAAVGPACGATDEEMSVSLGTVFILNAVALFLFPPIGRAAGLTQPQFGVWAAVAIHDTSSVVGAAARYGAVALQDATTIKLARALWIAPLALGTAWAFGRRSAGAAFPWFVLLFLLASAVRTALPGAAIAYDALWRAARIGLTATLFLIGAGMSVSRLRRVGARPLLQGVLLWVLVGACTLAATRLWVR